MLQPKFSVSQTSEHVIIRVNVPYVRVGDAEVSVEEQSISFFCQPYFLKLQLPGKVADEEHAKAVYNADEEHGTLTITLPKVIPGEHFADLDLPSKLLAAPADLPTKSTLADDDDVSSDSLPSLLSNLNLGQAPSPPPSASRGPQIEVVASSQAGDEEDTSFDPIPAAHSTVQTCGYGFNRRHVGLFSTLREEAASVVQLPLPDSVPAVLRPPLRQAQEDQAFDEERYCGDYAAGEGDPVYQDAVALAPWWCTLAQAHGAGQGGTAAAWAWSEEEQESMAEAKRRELLIDGQVTSAGMTSVSAPSPSSLGPERARILSSLCSMLFAYAYDHRSTGGDGSVESGWTMATLSAALAWLDDQLIVEPDQQGTLLLRPVDSRPYLHQLVEAAAVACVRRGITFPYMRRLDLCMLCLQDVAMILSLGRRAVLRSILSMRRVFAHDTDDKSGAPRYLLNKLWMDDMLLWLQAGGEGGCSDDLLAMAAAALLSALPAVTPTHPGLAGWDLPALHALVEQGGEVAEEGEESSQSDSQS